MSETTPPEIGIIENKPTPPVLEDKEETKKQVRLKLKERRFIKKYLELGNATEAYYQIYKVTRKSASTLGYELLKRIDFDLILEEAGITDKVAVDKLKEGLEADRPYGKDGDRIHPDYGVRLQYLNTILKLRKRLDNNTQPQQQMQGLQIIINK